MAVVYQIYPRSFADANGDGIGDLRGVIERLDYLEWLGVDTLWISPFFVSPQGDFGYDVSDYRAVAPEYGSMADCTALFDAAHARGMKVLLDLVLNHTSDQHPWFVESRSSRGNPKRHWYVWRDGRKPGGQAPPNNWRSMLGTRGWHYDAPTDQWYWAQFLPFQPDLNYRNPAVREAMLDVVRFWMERGVDGFRLDIINALFEDAEFRDNPFVWKLLPSPEDPSMFFRGCAHTLNHPDTLAFMNELRRVVDGFDERERVLVGEVIAPLETAREFCGKNADGLHLVFLFRSLAARLRAPELHELILLYEKFFPAPLQPTWVFSNHDRVRRITRLGGDMEQAKLNAALQLTARGVPFIYYGEEIGMEQHDLPLASALDPIAWRYRRLPALALWLIRWLTGEWLNRDGCRTPMQWDGGVNAGFCPAGTRPWLPVGPRVDEHNVAAQRSDPDSLLNCYRRFLHARRDTPALQRGDMRLLPVERPGQLLAYARRTASGEGTQEARVYLNCSAAEARLPLLPGSFRRLVSTRARMPDTGASGVVLSAWEGAVFLVG